MSHCYTAFTLGRQNELEKSNPNRGTAGRFAFGLRALPTVPPGTGHHKPERRMKIQIMGITYTMTHYVMGGSDISCVCDKNA